MRKNRILVLFLSSCVVLLLSACAKREIKNVDSRGENIICFGDSITFGYGAESDEDYPSRLGEMTKIPVINAGIDGDTSIEALKRLKSDVLSRSPLLVIIEFGGNDFLRQIPKETTIRNINEMIDKIQAKGAMAAVVDISAGMFLKEYRRKFAEIAQEKKAIFIPGILSGIITNPSLKSDFIHPNGNGYKAIAQRIYSTILPYLNQNTLAKEELARK
ncbi:MAG: arylesterase [Candidatus Omnitrophica bacterium]|nr:arylesterase [Candidatus Omnitrophota bacterium]